MNKPSDSKSTRELEESIRTTTSIHSFLNGQQMNMVEITPGRYIAKLMRQNNITKSQLHKRTNLSKSFFYEILSDKKQPSRNNFIQILLGLKLTFDECQNALKACQYSPLYARNRWDAVIIYCIENEKSLLDTNIILESQKLPILY
jgi:transcriptional regulator with XRE-family HTH domain